MEEGKGDRNLASGRQYGNALLGVRHQEEEALPAAPWPLTLTAILIAVLKQVFLVITGQIPILPSTLRCQNSQGLKLRQN